MVRQPPVLCISLPAASAAAPVMLLLPSPMMGEAHADELRFPLPKEIMSDASYNVGICRILLSCCRADAMLRPDVALEMTLCCGIVSGPVRLLHARAHRQHRHQLWCALRQLVCLLFAYAASRRTPHTQPSSTARLVMQMTESRESATWGASSCGICRVWCPTTAQSRAWTSTSKSRCKPALF